MLADFTALLSPLNLRPIDASMLVLVEANPGITLSALGQLLTVQRANMVPIVARLEEYGYILRIALDGRSFGLTLTDSGRKTCTKVSKAIETHEQQIMRRIPDAHREYLVPALKALWQNGK